MFPAFSSSAEAALRPWWLNSYLGEDLRAWWQRWWTTWTSRSPTSSCSSALPRSCLKPVTSSCTSALPSCPHHHQNGQVVNFLTTLNLRGKFQTIEGWNTPKHSLNRWLLHKVHHRATILRILPTIWMIRQISDSTITGASRGRKPSTRTIKHRCEQKPC